MRRLFGLLVLFLFVHLTHAQDHGKTLIFYATDQFTLTQTDKNELDKFIQFLPQDHQINIHIEGHTDKRGSDAYNLRLSEQRATAVKNYLISKGVAAEEIKIMAYGSSKPNEETNTLAKNRRTEIRIEVVENEVIKPTESTTDIQDFFKTAIIPPQEFCIDPTKDTLLKCNQGTVIQIKANSFGVPANASCVTFQVKEVFSKSDMILENLTTTSDGTILETQGMIYTNAMLNGDTLSLQKDITIMVPTDTVRNDVQLFDGQHDPHSGLINWTVNENGVDNFNLKTFNDLLLLNQLWQPCYGDSLSITLDSVRLMNQCRVQLGTLMGDDCNDVCKFFFCRIANLPKAVKGVFNKDVREANKVLRVCIRMNRFWSRNNNSEGIPTGIPQLKEGLIRPSVLSGKQQPTASEARALEILEAMELADSMAVNGTIKDELITKSNRLQTLFDLYDVDNIEDLANVIDQSLMDEAGVTNIRDLLKKLPKMNLSRMELAYKQRKIPYEDFNYYVFKNSRLGWQNLDIFRKYPPSRLAKLQIAVQPEKTSICRLVFKYRDFVLPGAIAEDHYYLEGVPKNEEAWLVGIKYVDGKALFALKDIKIASKKYELVFEELSLEELKEKLTILDK